MSDTVETMSSGSARFLQSESDRMGPGTIVRLVLYSVGLIACFMIPHYLREFCIARQLRESDQNMEDAAPPSEDVPGFTTGRPSVEAQSETRARRKEYRAERRARIVQVFSPFSMVLKEEHFHCGQDEKQRTEKMKCDSTKVNAIVAMEEGIKSPPEVAKVTNDDDDGLSNNDEIESGGEELSRDYFDFDDPYLEKTNFVEIPFTVNTDPVSTTRLVPCLCVICLGEYEVGDELVWSSNPLCEHTFHERCIEKWLMNQRGGVLCPCCRRAFIIDPFDLDDV